MSSLTSSPFLAPLEDASFSTFDPDLHPRGSLGRFVRVRFLGGTTGAFLVRSKRSEKQYVAKGGNHGDQVRSEYAANQLYEAAGVRVPATRFEDGHQIASYVEYGTPLGDLLRRGPSGWEPRSTPGSGDDERWRNVKEKLAEGFAMDAWLANWDVLGMDMDNVLVDFRTDEPWRVDNGGALRWRAQGGPKGEKWGPEASEVESLRRPGRSAAIVYGDLTDAEVAAQVRALPKAKLLSEVGRLEGDGMLTAEDAEILRKRLAWLEGWATRHGSPVSEARMIRPMDEAFLAPLEEVTALAGFPGWDPDEHPRDLLGRWRKKISGLVSGQTALLPGGAVVKKTRGGGFEYTDPVGKRVTTSSIDEAARGSFDRSAGSTHARSPGGSKRTTYDELAKEAGSPKTKPSGGGGEGTVEKPVVRKVDPPKISPSQNYEILDVREVVVDGKYVGTLQKRRDFEIVMSGRIQVGKRSMGSSWYFAPAGASSRDFRSRGATSQRDALDDLLKSLKLREGALDAAFAAPLEEDRLTRSLRRSLRYRGETADEKPKDPDFEKQHPRGTGDEGGQFVRKGDSGAAVRAVQRKVGAKVDGEFGRFTAAAVRRYQRRNGLQVDGVVGRQTAASLLGKTGKLPAPGAIRRPQLRALRGVSRRRTTSPSKRRRFGGGSLV